MTRRILVLVLAAVVAAGVTPPAAAQTGPLTIQNGVFAVNGQKKFIQSASYFGALRDAVLSPSGLITTLDLLKQRGFTGVRVLGTWWWNDPTTQPGCSTHFDPYPAIKGDGTLNFDALSPKNGWTPQALPAPYSGYGYGNSVIGRLQFLLDVAYQKGFVVDLSFAAETVGGLWDINNPSASIVRYGNGLQSISAVMASAFSLIPGLPQTGYRHVFIDVENEANYGVACKPAMTASMIRTLRDRVKAGDGARLVTASIAGSILADNGWTFLFGQVPSTLLDIVSYHEPRETLVFPCGTFPWYTATLYHIVGNASCGYAGWRNKTGDAIPIYFGEPERHRYVLQSNSNVNCATQFTAGAPSGCRDNWTAAQFLQAAKNAKLGGAAGWVWHTEYLFRYAASYFPAFLPNTEQLVVNSLQAELNTVTWPR
jgi:hypothetical protein